MIPSSSGDDRVRISAAILEYVECLLFESYLILRNKIIAGDVGCHLGVAGDDPFRSLQGTAKLVVAEMTAEPAVAVITVAQKAKVMDLDNLLLRLIICILFHEPADFLANLA